MLKMGQSNSKPLFPPPWGMVGRDKRRRDSGHDGAFLFPGVWSADAQERNARNWTSRAGRSYQKRRFS